MFDPPEPSEPEPPARDWSEAPSTSVPIDWSEPPRGSIPEWSESPRAPVSEWPEQPQEREWRRQQPSRAAPHTPFYIEMPFKGPTAHYPVRRPWWHGKGIHIAAACAIVAITALVVTNPWSSGDDVIASFDVVAKPGLTVVELDESEQPDAPVPVVAPAPQPSAAAAPVAVEPAAAPVTAPAPVVAAPAPQAAAPVGPAQGASAVESGAAAPKNESEQVGSAQWYRLPLVAAERERAAPVAREASVGSSVRVEPPARAERRLRLAPAEKPAPRAVSRAKAKPVPRTSLWDAPAPQRERPPAPSGDPLPMHLL
jgi:hypothetical protein